MSWEIVDPGDQPLGRTVDDWVSLYKNERTRFYDFTREIHAILEKNFALEQLESSSIEARTKSVESFAEKLSRDGKEYHNPIEQITDLSGCRIICFYNDDVVRIEQIIRENLSVDERNSVDKLNIRAANEFGYLSRHLIVGLNEDRLKLNEYKRFKGMRAEVQIRSVLQHAWAAIEHKLQYKNRADVPQPLRRRLFQIAAVLELADDQFSSIRNSIGSLRQEYRAELERGSKTVLLDVESLDVFIETSDLLREIRAAVSSQEIHISPRPPNAQNPLSKLNNSLAIAGIGRMDELSNLVESRKPAEWASELEKIGKTWVNIGYSDAKGGFSPQANLSPKALVVDDPVILRIVVLACAPKSRRQKMLKEVPFGQRLQSAIEVWSASLDSE